MTLSKKLFAEFLGTAGLLAVVVGSGIMGERLAGGNAAVALLGNSIATGAGLVVLIYGFGNISGSHFNPAVTLTEALNGRMNRKQAILYVAVQIAGAVAGVILANLLFELPAVNLSAKVRTGTGQYLGEFVATFGLIAVIRLGARFHPKLVGALVACYITAAYWFTSSTSFANPAVTIARSLSNTFAGIALESVPMFIVSQLAGALAAMLIFNWLLVEEKEMSDKPRILILCTGNSARSQMAEGIFKQVFGSRFEVDSAGTQPSIVRPEAIAALAEIGLDISTNRSKSVDEFADAEVDYVLTVCDNANENCPYFPAKTKRIHHAFEDPAEAQGDFDERLAKFRRVRDRILEYAKDEFGSIITQRNDL